MKLILIASILLFVTACESKGSAGSSIMLEKTNVSESMGGEYLTIPYKECVSDISEETLESFKEEAQGDFETKSATKVSTCPTPYDALCESNFGKFYYYSDAKRILDSKKEECGHMGGKWTANTQGKEVVAKTYKATFNLNGTPYIYESTNNCRVNPINADIISTPQLSDDATWVKLSANTKKGEQGCIFDFNINGKHYHAEKCDVNYDGKTLTGKTAARNIQKHDDNVEITFDIVCD